MTNNLSQSSDPEGPPRLPADSDLPRGVAELIRHGCQLAGRQGFRVAAHGVRGQIFFEDGQVIHAEFGEDCGLRAIVEMLRAGSVVLEPWMLRWPSQPSMHLRSELMLSLIERGDVREVGKFDSRVVRKVRLEADSLPLPAPSTPKAPVTAGVAGATPNVLRPESAVSGIRPVVRAERRQSRAVVARNLPHVLMEAEALGSSPGAAAPEPLAGAGFDDGPTTMVRIAAHGSLLAARGKHAERLADAAAFIHEVANLIASDLGRNGRANLHLRGGGQSLLVVRSEVNDIAAALGPTTRLTSLLAKVGLQ